MIPPRRAWLLLALCVLAVGGCVSVARAAEDLDAASIGGWSQGGIGGFTGAILTLALVMVQQEVKSRREAKQAQTAPAPAAPGLREIEELVTRAAKAAELDRRVAELEREVHDLKQDVASPLDEIRKSLSTLASRSGP